MNVLKNSQDSWNIQQIYSFLEETSRFVHRKTPNFTIIDQEKNNIFNWNSMTTRFVMKAPDLRYQYRISVAEAQTSLGTRSEKRRLYSLANNLQKKKKRSKADFTVGNNLFLLPIFQKARSSFFRV